MTFYDIVNNMIILIKSTGLDQEFLIPKHFFDYKDYKNSLVLVAC